MIKYDKTFEELNETIEVAQNKGFLDEKSGLIMIGRILMSHERDELTNEEYSFLMAKVFPNYKDDLERDIQIAVIGCPASEVEHTH